MASKKAKAPSKKSSVSDVDEFMAALDHPLKAEIEALRKIILGADKRITESIKWNAPSYSLKDDFATFHLRPKDKVTIIFHRGAKSKDSDVDKMDIKDPAGLLTWLAKTRCRATFEGMKAIQANKAALQSIIQQWIKLLGNDQSD